MAINPSEAPSPEAGLEEALTIHRLRVPEATSPHFDLYERKVNRLSPFLGPFAEDVSGLPLFLPRPAIQTTAARRDGQVMVSDSSSEGYR